MMEGSALVTKTFEYPQCISGHAEVPPPTLRGSVIDIESWLFSGFEL